MAWTTTISPPLRRQRQQMIYKTGRIRPLLPHDNKHRPIAIFGDGFPARKPRTLSCARRVKDPLMHRPCDLPSIWINAWVSVDGRRRPPRETPRRGVAPIVSSDETTTYCFGLIFFLIGIQRFCSAFFLAYTDFQSEIFRDL